MNEWLEIVKYRFSYNSNWNQIPALKSSHSLGFFTPCETPRQLMGALGFHKLFKCLQHSFLYGVVEKWRDQKTNL